MPQPHRKFIQDALELAKTSQMESMHGCIIAHKNNAIANGINAHIYNQENRGVFSRHAEMSALANLIAIKGHNAKFLSECVVYVARVGPESIGFPPRMSKPCDKCLKLLQKVGIKKFVFTYNDDLICTISKI